MGYHYVVLGAGRQGVALAYDLARNGEAARVVLAEQDAAVAREAVMRLQALLPDCADRFESSICDVSKSGEVAVTIAGADVLVSAVPYRFNVALTDAAIAARASLCDLGGNTSVVREQLACHERARAAGVSIVPDCGLAPGLGNHLAAHALATLDEPEHIHVRCGGLPETPTGALGYKLVFNFDGLANEYSGVGEFLRDGERVDVPALTEVEAIEFPPPVGACEAAVTSGGTSTCPDTFAGRVQSYDYKTVRYPSHFAIMRALFELGLFEHSVAGADGATLQPRAVLRQLMEQRLSFPDVRDIVVLRCTARGRHAGRAVTRTYDLFDRHDEKTGFTAMERGTAFPAALVAHMQARKVIEPGAQPLEVSVPAVRYLEELPQHDIRVEIVTTEDA